MLESLFKFKKFKQGFLFVNKQKSVALYFSVSGTKLNLIYPWKIIFFSSFCRFMGNLSSGTCTYGCKTSAAKYHLYTL